MTTIAYRNGVHAADSRGTAGDWVQPGGMEKLFWLPDGGMAAVAGDYVEGMKVIRWIKGDEQGEHPSIGDHSRVVRVLPSGVIRMYEAAGHFDLDVPFGAWGSGMPPALAALHMGASPMEAVRIAALIDPYTGGDIWEMSVEDRNAQPD